MLKTILNFSEKKYYWLTLLILSICLESVALFYQYVLEYQPCVLCIHVRIWVLGLFIISLFGILFYKNWTILLSLHALTTAIMAGLFERSYQLLGTERGFIYGSCSMESGLPSWFALDEWIPLLFKVWEPCGYTPELLFTITMAEALIVLSFCLLVISSLFTINHLVTRIKKN